jgi:hypothetical protein
MPVIEREDCLNAFSAGADGEFPSCFVPISNLGAVAVGSAKGKLT